MSSKYSSVLLFGAPGVGKGTQGKLLGQVPGFIHMASGDIFRSLDKGSELGTPRHASLRRAGAFSVRCSVFG